MASSLVLPDGFSWLAASCRPSALEVETYTQFLAAAEGTTLRSVETLRREAELQLWIWCTENRQPPPKRRHPPRAHRRKPR